MSGGDTTLQGAVLSGQQITEVIGGKPLPIRFELRDMLGKSVETVRVDSTFILH